MSGEPPGDGKPISRRVVLGMFGAGIAGIVFGARAQDVVGTGEHFRLYSVSETFPARPAEEYRLEVSGLVDRPLDLSLDDLRALPATRLERDFQCVTGWRVRKVSWRGVRLSDLLDRAGIRPEARALTFTSFDGVYSESLTLEQARRPDVMVAYEMQGRPVSRLHGGPARLYVAPMYGYKSLKWLESIVVTDQVRPGYWERRDGYSIDGWVGRSNARQGDAPT